MNGKLDLLVNTAIFISKTFTKKLKKELEELGRNWDTLNFTYHVIELGLEESALSLSEKYVAVTGEDFTIKLWNRKTWNCDKVFQGHQDFVYCLFYQNVLITASWDKTIKVWNFETTELLNTVRDSLGVVHQFKHDNGYLVSVSSSSKEEMSCLTVVK